LEEVLREAGLTRSKVERMEDLLEERLIGYDEPLEDEAEAMGECLEAKEKGDAEYTPLKKIEWGR
jgi:DNA-directed RNA polymerase sigma subunit (sigma70/sigma32)